METKLQHSNMTTLLKIYSIQFCVQENNHKKYNHQNSLLNSDLDQSLFTKYTHIKPVVTAVKMILQHSLQTIYQCSLKHVPRGQNYCYPALCWAEILRNKGLHKKTVVHCGKPILCLSYNHPVHWLSLFETQLFSPITQEAYWIFIEHSQTSGEEVLLLSHNQLQFPRAKMEFQIIPITNCTKPCPGLLGNGAFPSVWPLL